MRRMHQSVERVGRPVRIGSALLLVALLVQFLLPLAVTRAMAAEPFPDAVPICRGAAAAGPGHSPHKMVHAACLLCQAPAMAWGFVLPTVGSAFIVERRVAEAPWRWMAQAGIGVAPVALRARGPPALA